MANRTRPHFFGIWLSDNGADLINQRADEERVSKSELLRRMLAYATLHMPASWRPPKP